MMVQTRFDNRRPRFRSVIEPGKAVIIIALILFFAGCSIGKRKPTRLAQQYALEYNSPVVNSPLRVDESITVERISVAHAFNTSEMVYSPEPFKRRVYFYHRWRSNPGDMVTDYLLRDLRNAGIFGAAFSYRDTGDSRFLLEGGIEEFLEVDGKDGQEALLTLHVTFLDLSQKEMTKRIIFQKTYRYSDSMAEKSPAALAMSMSRAMEKISGQLIGDLQEAAAVLKK